MCVHYSEKVPILISFYAFLGFPYIAFVVIGLRLQCLQLPYGQTLIRA